MKKKKKEKSKFSLSKLLLILLILIPIIGFLLIVVSDNDTLMFIGFGSFPLFGMLSIPFAIKFGRKYVKELDTNYEESKSNLDKGFNKNENINDYHKRVVFQIIKTAIIAIIAIIIIMIFLLYRSGNIFTDEGQTWLENRSTVSKVFHKNRDIEGGAFLFVFGILTFGIPIIAYAITYYAHKVRFILKRKYISYIGTVDHIDLKYRIHLIGKNDEYKHIIDSYKRIGIRKKDLIGKEVVLVFSLDKVYIFPVNK